MFTTILATKYPGGFPVLVNYYDLHHWRRTRNIWIDGLEKISWILLVSRGVYRLPKGWGVYLGILGFLREHYLEDGLPGLVSS